MKISPQSLEQMHRTVFVPAIEENSSWNRLQINVDNLMPEIFVKEHSRLVYCHILTYLASLNFNAVSFLSLQMSDMAFSDDLTLLVRQLHWWKARYLTLRDNVLIILY